MPKFDSLPERSPQQGDYVLAQSKGGKTSRIKVGAEGGGIVTGGDVATADKPGIVKPDGETIKAIDRGGIGTVTRPGFNDDEHPHLEFHTDELGPLYEYGPSTFSFTELYRLFAILYHYERQPYQNPWDLFAEYELDSQYILSKVDGFLGKLFEFFDSNMLYEGAGLADDIYYETIDPDTIIELFQDSRENKIAVTPEEQDMGQFNMLMASMMLDFVVDSYGSYAYQSNDGFFEYSNIETYFKLRFRDSEDVIANELLNDDKFIDGLTENNTFLVSIANNRDLLDYYAEDIAQNETFLSALAQNETFVTALTSNQTFIDALLEKLPVLKVQ